MPIHQIPLADIPEGVPHQPPGVKAVLIRDGDAVTALAPTCPHLGLPLAKGVVRDGTLICAFHHACFDAATGRQTQPPGHGDLRRYPVAIADGTVTVEVDEGDLHPAPPHARRGAESRRVVIAGSGAAADACALALREEGFEGIVEMISPEGAPYDRTMLSKAVLTGDKAVSDLTLTPPGALAARDVALIDGTVTAVAPGRVALADGGGREFDALLVAPGGRPNRMDLPGADLAGLHVLRSAAQAAVLAQAAGPAARAVVIGGGFIGMEGALSLAKRGLDVTVVLREEVPLARILGDRVGRAILAEHETARVTFETGADVAAFDGEDGTVAAIRMKDGRTLAADLVLLAIGVRPATDVIDGLPADDDGGVTVVADLSVPGLDGVYVAGDAARAPTPFGPARIEHWRVAQQHGRAAARAMLGRPSGPDIPFFWTALARQYRYLGHAEAWDDILFDGDPSEGAFLARYVRDGRVMAALTAGRDAELAELHLRMAEAGGPVPA
jgi:NADPH-dependent 2,4-dienoyl-CoA reductase/sulfur reductase-like enzyme/nitrite reductase/ring-hydroxylating ferredoxin subunit